MPKSVRSFGYYLRQFARSVDIVDERTIEEIRKLVYDYVRDELEIGFFTLATRAIVNGERGLQSQWRTEGPPATSTIRGADGGYSEHISVAFDTGKPLWIVNAGQQPLRTADSYREMWSGMEGLLPTYRAPINRPMKTSIIVPLEHMGSPIA